jgi:hypothetical protein
MNTAEAKEAILLLQPTPESVIFIDATSIDVEALERTGWPNRLAGCLIVPIVRGEGETFQDVVDQRYLGRDTLEVYRAMTHVLTAEQIDAVTAKVQEMRDPRFPRGDDGRAKESR